MSAYIKLSTLEYPRHIGDIEIDPAGMADYAHVEYVAAPAFDPYTQQITQKPPEQRDGQWFMVWQVAPIPEAEMAEKVRKDRNQRLAESDWTQLADSPADKTSWATYRQDLRDISAQAGFPWEVTWPTKPE
jgi:hypothetical protein